MCACVCGVRVCGVCVFVVVCVWCGCMVCFVGDWCVCGVCVVCLLVCCVFVCVGYVFDVCMCMYVVLCV